MVREHWRPALTAALLAIAQLGSLGPLQTIQPAAALATLPSGFSDSLFASGFGGRLTAMTFAADGRLFVSEKQGAIRIVKNGSLLTRPFLTLSTNTDAENGLKAIDFDPNYATNGRFYVYYTDATTVLNKVSRFTVSASDPDVADPASEVVLADGIATGVFHSAGALHFGSDGKLYISTGDGSYGPNAQDMTNLNGKILRINTDGSVPADNPYVGQANIKPQIWANGLRNPFTFAFDPGSQRMLINDVGNSTWEEIDQGQAGANYGWPTCEGMCNNAGFVNPVYTYNHNDGPGKSVTGAVFYRGTVFPSEYRGDYFFGDYVGNYIKRFNPQTGAVTDFATNALNPVDLDIGPDGALYYLSVEAKTVDRIAYGDTAPPPPPPDPGNAIQNPGFEQNIPFGYPGPWRSSVTSPAKSTLTRDTTDFASGTASARVDITTASRDWHVQLLQPNVPLTANKVYTLTFYARATSNRTVRAALQKNSAPYPVYIDKTFSIGTTWQPYTLSFTPSTTDAKALFNFNLGAATGSVWIDDVGLATTTTIGSAPVPVITAPVTGTTFRAGDTINFAGSATDDEDGNIPAARLTWEIVFHHDQHTHPFIEPFSGQSSGSFVASTTGEASANVWYRIHLRATDTDGNTAEVTRDVVPITQQFTLATQPAGLALTLDGSPVTAPQTITGVVGFQREIGAPQSQSLNGTTYQFIGWSDNGAATHNIATPATATTYTATYAAVSGNAFQNPGFEQNIPFAYPGAWRSSVTSPAKATVTRDTTNPESGAAAARVDITTASRDWHVQLLQPNLPLTAGRLQTMSFWARASSNRTIRVAFQKNSAPYPVYVEKTFSLTTTWQQFTFSLTPATTDTKTLFNFNLGTATGSVWLDDVVLTP